jgi:hypothetical protein
MYYPQSKTTQTVKGYVLPILSFQITPGVDNQVTWVSPNPGDPAQSPITVPCPLKVTDADPYKAMATDLLMLMSQLGHQNSGRPGGANALFPDNHVVFNAVSGNSGVNQAFEVSIWNACPSSTLGNDNPAEAQGMINFRRVFSYFQP